MSHPLLSSAFEAETDRLTDTVVREGNTIELLPSGISSYEKRWELLEAARHSIHIATFSFMRDKTTKRLCGLLRAKMNDGVEVRLVVDDAVLYSTFSGKRVDKLARDGVEVLRYHRLFRDWLPKWGRGGPIRQVVKATKLKLKRRFHEKYFVVDGKEAILGGMNWGDKYAQGGASPKAWRDSDCYITGPVVADIQRQYLRDVRLYDAMEREYEARTEAGFDREAFFEEAKREGEALIQQQAPAYFPELTTTGAEKIRYIPHKPYDEERLRLTEAYLMMFREAKEYIYWGCHGIRPPRVIADALAAAVRRGVEVRLITNSRKSSRTLMAFGVLGWMYWESSNHFSGLIESGIRVFEWLKPGAFHSKCCVIDDVVASIGSYNIARGWSFHHTESNVVIYGGPFCRATHDQFHIDFQDCRELTLDTVRKIKPKHDPFRRLLHERNLLIDRSLLSEPVAADLDAGRYKRM